MAIIKCPECGHQVSEKAPTCPSCGVRIVGNIIRCQECGQVYFKDEALCPVCHNPSPVMNRPVNMGAQPAVSAPVNAGMQAANAQPAAPEAEPQPDEKKKKNYVPLVISLIFALVVAGVMCFYLNDANEQKEEQAYEFAIESNDPMVLQQYLDNYKDFNEAHRDSIQARLARIQQTNTEWTNAVVSGTRDALMQYIKDNPGSIHEGEARNKIDSIDFNEADKAKTIDAYQAYLDEHPDGKFADQAKNEIDGMKATTVLPDEEMMIKSAFRKFFQSVNSRNEDGVVSTMAGTITSFLGKMGAGAPEVAEFINKLYKSDIVNMNWHILDDYNIKKSADQDGAYKYDVVFSAEQNIERKDASQPKYQKYQITATVDSEGKISSFNMKKMQ
ncbi:MAG: zinc ribbon domain-containing protein [Prevotella sp.]|nr:zinc ribbon domain-containing protein [Prevotella sp.]MDD6535858.1 zinc ribbon domain-containing protein [Prevotella sp.]MDD7507417.1 zinc ribbon domain-containing protein [Prevotella sp.]